MNEVAIPAASPGCFDSVAGPVRAREFAEALEQARSLLDGGTLWHVSSTEQGGGVAEMLQSLLPYLVGADLRTRWLVIDANPAFFEVTKRIHFLLHGHPGDGGALAANERTVYEHALAPNALSVADLVRGGDPVILHDPQSLGLAQALQQAGARVIWNCHIGADRPNAHSRSAWRFLWPYLKDTDAQVFSRAQYVWEGLDAQRVAIIPPCLDMFSPKNQHLDRDTIAAILGTSEVVPGQDNGRAIFTRQDGTTGKVSSRARMIEDEALPPEAPIVTQVSRWDPLKDHAGVMAGFARHVPHESGAHLVLAGPDTGSIKDDPSSNETLEKLCEAFQELEASQRARVHVACLPMGDVEENAAVVNALQRRSDVIVQKSIAEGFGLTVAESMWKARPTIGSKVGGIQDQIEHGRSGLLIENPHDLASMGRAITNLLEDPQVAARMGHAAHQRVKDEYLPPRYFSRYLRLIEKCMTAANNSAGSP